MPQLWRAEPQSFSTAIRFALERDKFVKPLNDSVVVGCKSVGNAAGFQIPRREQHPVSK